MTNLSIQYRVSIYAGLCVLMTIVTLLGFGIYQSNKTNAFIYEANSQMLSAQVQQQIRAGAQEQAKLVQSVLNDAMTSSRSLAAAFASFQGIEQSLISKPDFKRVELNEMLHSVLADNSNFMGIYTAWEPNALDKMDNTFAGNTQLGSDASGRFVPYWYRAVNGQIMQEPLIGYESQKIQESGNREGEYYLCSKDTQSECAIDPYAYELEGKQVLLASIVAPIVIDGAFSGIVGVDLKLDFVQELAAQLSRSLYEGQSRIQLISNNGNIAADSYDPTLLGKNLQSISDERFKKAKAIGKSKQSSVGLDTTGQLIQVIAPLQIGRSDATWALLIDVPFSVVESKLGQLEDITSKAQTQSTMIQIILGGGLTIAAILLILWMARSITGPLKETIARLKDLAQGEGDLTHRLEVAGKDECAQVAQNINHLLDKLQAMMLKLANSAEKVSLSADQSSQISAVATNGILGQRTQLDSIASAITEMSTAAQEVAKHARQAAEAAQSTDESADSGKRIVSETASCIQTLAIEMESASNVISRLENYAKDIGGILDVIQGVAEQTNLLALNAAIEAARAGEQGRGFAVVADEVRVLARRTHDATTQINEQIGNLQDCTQEAVTAMGRGKNEVDRSVKSAVAAAEALNEIQNSVAVITQMNTHIANAANEQGTVAEDVNRNINEIGHAADEVADAAQQSQSASQELNDLALELGQTMAQFKIR